MKEADILSLAEPLVEEYSSLLHIDPYFKVQIEISDSIRVSDCVEADAPATWKLRINPSQHLDDIDVQMSAANAALTILFRDIPASKKLDEVKSKLTHALVQLTALDDGEADEAVEDAQPD